MPDPRPYPDVPSRYMDPKYKGQLLALSPPIVESTPVQLALRATYIEVMFARRGGSVCPRRLYGTAVEAAHTPPVRRTPPTRYAIWLCKPGNPISPNRRAQLVWLLSCRSCTVVSCLLKFTRTCCRASGTRDVLDSLAVMSCTSFSFHDMI